MMRILSYSALLLFGLFVYSCDLRLDQLDAKANNEESSREDSVLDKLAISLWDGAGLREEPGRRSSIKYLTTVYFGERVEMLDTTSFIAGENRTYMKVRLSDGQEGWVNQYLFVEGNELVAVTKDVELFRRPDQMTFKDELFKRGEIAVLEDQKDDWMKLVGIEREKSGWINARNHISRVPEDVRLALKLNRAIRTSSGQARKEKLESILQDEKSSGSNLIDLVSKNIRKLKSVGSSATKKEMPKVAKNDSSKELRITVPNTQIYKIPELKEENILSQIEVGTLCKVIRKGPQSVVDSMEDYWYQIKHEDLVGWVYGSNTSISLVDN